jgi:hypothetical protein
MYYSLWLKLESFTAPGLNEKEQADLAGLDAMSPEEQAKLDIRLHMSALKPGEDRFDSGDRQMLASDISDTKLRFIKLIKQRSPDPGEVSEVIQLLKRDIQSHEKHMNKTSEDYGTPAWHQTWINVYDDWINRLSSLIVSSRGS